MTTKDINAPEAAQLMQDHVFTKHGVPSMIISDRDPKFKSKFWTTLADLLDIKLNMSTADHPETDGQSEVMIKILSSMIRSSIQDSPDTWHEVLSTLEYEYNSSKNLSTGLTPFEVDIGRIPLNVRGRKLGECGVKSQSAKERLDKIDAFRILARDNLAAAQARQKHYADEKRRDVTFKEGDLVLLRSKDLDAFRRSSLPSKWRTKYMGPLKVKEVLRKVTYRIELPPTMKRAHNVFHVSKLKPYKKPLGHAGPLSIVIDVDGSTEQEVHAILDKKRMQKKLYYLVQFDGDPESEAEWKHVSELSNCRDKISEFNKSTRSSNPKRGCRELLVFKPIVVEDDEGTTEERQQR